MSNCKWCGEDYKVDEETGLCKWCAEKKVAIKKRLRHEWEARHTGTAIGFDECYGTTHILDFAWCPKLGGADQIFYHANYLAALKRLPEDYVFETGFGHWTTDHDCLSIHIWDDEKQMPTPAWDVYAEMQKDMERYPALDDEILSRLEWEDLNETVENCYDYDVKKEIRRVLEENDNYEAPLLFMPDDWVDQILRHENAQNWSCGDDISSKAMDAIICELVQLWVADVLDPEAALYRRTMEEAKKYMRRLV